MGSELGGWLKDSLREDIPNISFDVILLLQCYFKCVNHSFVFCP